MSEHDVQILGKEAKTSVASQEKNLNPVKRIGNRSAQGVHKKKKKQELEGGFFLCFFFSFYQELSKKL